MRLGFTVAQGSRVKPRGRAEKSTQHCTQHRTLTVFVTYCNSPFSLQRLINRASSVIPSSSCLMPDYLKQGGGFAWQIYAGPNSTAREEDARFLSACSGEALDETSSITRYTRESQRVLGRSVVVIVTVAARRGRIARCDQDHHEQRNYHQTV